MKRLLIAIVLLASLTVISSPASASPFVRYRYYPRYRVAPPAYVYPTYTYAYPVTTYPYPVYGNYGYRGYGPVTTYVPPVVNARAFGYGPYIPY
jgi:hypothetical protein